MSAINKSHSIIYQDIFVYDKGLGTLTINRIEVWLNPLFKTIQLRSKEVLDTYKDKAKIPLIQDASKELLYIYLMEDPRSSIIDFDESERKKRAIGLSGLPIDYKEDETIKDARKVYAKDYVKVSTTGLAYLTASKTYNALSMSLGETQERLSFLRGMASDKMNTVYDSDTTKEAKDIELADILATEKQIKDLQDSLVKTLTQLPTLEDTVDKLKAKWAMELGSKKEVYGGGQVYNREE